MSNNNFPQALKLILAMVIALSAVVRVQAHGGPPRLELAAKQASAGAPLELWGINLGADLPVTVSLIGGGVEYPLGTVICDGHGDFLQTFRLPSELAPGTYTVRAINAADLVV